MNKLYAACTALLVGGLTATPAHLHAEDATHRVTAPQGGVARWSGEAAAHCGIYGRRYPAIEGVCYYPVDLAAKPGLHDIALWNAKGERKTGSLMVQKADFPSVDMVLPESMQAYLDPPKDARARAARERTQVVRILDGEDAPARFTLPLESPVANLPSSEDDFGSIRRFGEGHRSLHTGRDYPVSSGTPLRAVADGRVVLADDHYYSGKSVFVDHGGGLVSMLFHLDKIDVKPGDSVTRGQALGTVGATGRATGPHLHIGLRWLGKRIDPALLLAPPASLPGVSDTRAEAQSKIQRAERRDVDEGDQQVDDEE